MKKLVKRIAAMGCATIMAASMAMNASAANNTYDLYISSASSKTSTTCVTGYASNTGTLTTITKLNGVSSGAVITYKTYVNGIYVGSHSKISKKGSCPQDYSNSNIKKGKKITMKIYLSPSPAGIGSTANGSVSGK